MPMSKSIAVHLTILKVHFSEKKVKLTLKLGPLRLLSPSPTKGGRQNGAENNSAEMGSLEVKGRRKDVQTELKKQS